MQNMHRRYRFALILTVLLAILLPTLAYAAPADYNRNTPEALTQDQLYGESAILIDASNGNVLFSKNADQRMYPASTTKMMTALLACEVGWDFDMEITIPSEAADIPGDSSLVPVYPGEVMKYGDLIYGMMMHSGNDGANALAVLVGGTIQNFVQLMNKRAEEIGCTNTHFVNAHGYHDENHYTTAHDLALIAQEAMKNEKFRMVSSTFKRDIVIQSNGGVREITLRNKDEMLNPNSDYYLEGNVGIKTGSHRAAGQCFVNAVDKDDIMLISVTLKCEGEYDKWVDSIRMTRYGYTCYTSYPLEKLFEMVSPRIAQTRAANASKKDPNGGILQFQLAQISEPDFTRKVQSGSAPALSDALEDFANSIEIKLYDNLVAPITQGEAVGTLTYTKANGGYITATLISANDIAEQPKYPAIFDILPFLHIFDNLLVRLLALFILLFIVAFFLADHARKKREKKRRAKLIAMRKKAYAKRDREEMAKRKRRTSAKSTKTTQAKRSTTSGRSEATPKRTATRTTNGAPRRSASASTSGPRPPKAKTAPRRSPDDLFDV